MNVSRNPLVAVGLLSIVCAIDAMGIASNAYGQGARLMPRTVYQAIPTRCDRGGEFASTDEVALSEVVLDNRSDAVPQADGQAIAQSMAPGIDPRFGVDFEINLPIKFDLTDYLPTPGKQVRNDCVAWAIAYSAYSCQIGQERRRKPTDPSDLFSPAFIFDQLSVDGQALHALQAIHLVRKSGCATNATMNSAGVNPSMKAMAEAATFRMQRNERADTLDEIRTYIYQGYPVVLIIQMGGDFRSDEVVATPYRWAEERNKIDGYHALTAVGYDDDRNAVLVMNSWGTQWKNGGFAWVSYDNFDQMDVSGWCPEAHVIGVKSFAPINVTMDSRNRGRSFHRRPSRFQRRLIQLAVDRRVYEAGEVISPHGWVFNDIACNQDSLFVLGPDQTVFRMNEDDEGRSWTHLNSGEFRHKKVAMLACDRSSALLALTRSQELFQYVEPAGNWEPVQLPAPESAPVDLRVVDEKIRVTKSDGTVFVHERNDHWSLAP